MAKLIEIDPDKLRHEITENTNRQIKALQTYHLTRGAIELGIVQITKDEEENMRAIRKIEWLTAEGTPGTLSTDGRQLKRAEQVAIVAGIRSLQKYGKPVDYQIDPIVDAQIMRMNLDELAEELNMASSIGLTDGIMERT